MVDNTTLLYDMLRDIKDELCEIKDVQAKQAVSLDIHIKRTELAEQNIEMLRKSEAECPGRKSAQWNKGLVDRIKDVSIMVGLITALLKLFGVI